MISGYAYPVIDFPVLAITFPNGLRCLCMSQPLRGALIGCGFFGRIQLEAWHRMPDVEIVAACDPDLDRAKQAAPRAYAEPEAMLAAEQLDFVDIATRPDSHLPLVRLAVAHRIPAICQKPVAESLAQAIEMARVAGASGVRVMVHENWRWQPWYREAKKLIGEGAIGKPLAYQFRLRQRDGLGAEPFPNQPYFRLMPRLLIYETLIHPIDTARFLFGDITTVLAHLRRYNAQIAGEDRAIVILSHGAAAVDGVVDGHRWANPIPAGPAMGDTLIEGEEGVLRILANGEVYRNETLVTAHDTSVGYKGDSVRATQQHFLDALRTGTAFETGVSEYLNSFAAVEAAYQSAAEQRCVALSDLVDSQ
jgi:predicted dehydrogenase